jgi:hypothetical protein
MDAGFYWPSKYYRGLSKRKQTQRRKDAEKRSRMSWKLRSAYKPFETDRGVKTRRSGYTQEWKRRYPNASGLTTAAKITGVPKPILTKSYNRGKAAWRTGHRPGATAEQWGYARAYSLLLCGKTHYTTDSDLVRKAKKTAKARRWFNKTCKSSPVKYNAV